MSEAYRLKNGDGDMYSSRYPYRVDVLADIHGPSKTRQEFTDECDVNNIMARYEATSVWPFKEPGPPVYYDFVGMPDLQGALKELYDAEEAFMTLPAKVRKEFDNDPVRFVEYASNGDNIEQLRKWGLAEPEKPKEPPPLGSAENPIHSVASAPPIVPAKA